MSYELFIARRLRLGSAGGHPPASIIIAMTGIALSLVIMMAAMCIVLGFKAEIRDKVMGFDANVTIHAASCADSGDGLLTLSPALDSVISSTGLFGEPGLVMRQSGILKTDTDFQAIVLKGMDKGPGLQFIADNIVEGEMPDYSDDAARNRIVISRVTANLLRLAPGDRPYAYFFHNGAVKTRRLEIAAIYDTHFSDYDRIYAYCSLGLARGITGSGPGSGTAIELTVRDKDDITGSAIMLQDAMMTASYTGRLDGLYRLSSVLDTGMMYFNWLALLDTNVVVILALMMAVSGFTLVSSLFIIILERVRMIGLLKALGATNGQIRRIFILLAQKLVLAGMLAGNVIGISLLYAQHRLHFLPLDPDAYYLNFVPVQLDWLHILLLNAGVFIASWLIILLPSHLVAKIDPCKSIRYE